MLRFLSALVVATVMAASPLRAEPAAGAATVPLAAVATFAAGCYWCVESDFDKVKGVIETTSGFMGGHVENPTYEQVGSGTTGHLEVVRVTYDPTVVSYQKLLDHYWVNVDPLDGGGQFCDRGHHYSPAIFTYGDEQKTMAEASKKKIEDSKRFGEQPIVVQILPASAFTPAHDQDFYKTNSVRYKFYRAGCGRDARLKQLWGDKAGS